MYIRRFVLILLCCFGYLHSGVLELLNPENGRGSSSITSVSKTNIPKKIWQTYRTNKLPKPAIAPQHSWQMHNPDFAYYFSDDDEIDDYVRTHGDEEIYRFFCALPLGVMKADLWRYLIIAEEGGVYTDIDSFCCKPIHRWLIDAPSDAKDLLLLGLEDSMHFFCQWTIVATAHHPAMEYVCNYLVQSWREKGIDLRDPHFVHGTTGPGIWTEALLDYIGEPQATPQQIFEYYQREPAFRERLHGLGIWILPATHYSGLWSRHLFASQSFGEGYVRWPEERERLHKAQAGS